MEEGDGLKRPVEAYVQEQGPLGAKEGVTIEKSSDFLKYDMRGSLSRRSNATYGGPGGGLGVLEKRYKTSMKTPSRSGGGLVFF